MIYYKMNVYTDTLKILDADNLPISDYSSDSSESSSALSLFDEDRPEETTRETRRERSGLSCFYFVRAISIAYILILLMLVFYYRVVIETESEMRNCVGLSVPRYYSRTVAKYKIESAIRIAKRYNIDEVRVSTIHDFDENDFDGGDEMYILYDTEKNIEARCLYLSENALRKNLRQKLYMTAGHP